MKGTLSVKLKVLNIFTLAFLPTSAKSWEKCDAVVALPPFPVKNMFEPFYLAFKKQSVTLVISLKSKDSINSVIYSQ